MGSDFTIELNDGVVDVRIDRGDERNLLTMEMCVALIDYLRHPPDGAHVLRLRTTGPVFCLGRERGAEDAGELRTEAGMLAEVNDGLRGSPLVTVAEVSGDAAGFGVGLAANADIAVASEDARFWFPEVFIELAPAVVLAWLPGIVGRKQAFWLTATGRKISAERAQRLGLLTAVTSREDLVADVDAIVGELRGLAPRVHRGIKDYLTTIEGLPPAGASALAVERLIIGSMSRKKSGEHDE